MVMMAQRYVVVIAEDDEIQRELLKSILELDRLTVLEARNGHEALDAVARHRPDLLITDNFMPSMDGYALIREVRRSKEFGSTLPIVLLSAADRDAERLAEDRTGLSRYVQKPIDTDDFLSVIRSLLAGERRGVDPKADRTPDRTI